MFSRLLVIFVGAGSLAVGAFGIQSTDDVIEIPESKIDLVSGKAGVRDDWWKKHVTDKLNNIKTALWGNDLPQVTASAAQDHQRCPIIKLPSTFSSAAKTSSWRRLYGEWNTGNDVTVATFEQNYLMMGFTRNISQVSVLFRTAATGQVAVRTRPFSDEEMLDLYNWKAAQVKASALAGGAAKGSKKAAAAVKAPAAAAKGTKKGSLLSAPNATKSAAAANGTGATAPAAPLQTHTDFNLAIFDCAGALMYVVKEKLGTPPHIELFSRDGSLVSSSVIGEPILRYQFVDPKSGYLIATAEAPGINSSISRHDIPKDVELGNVLPFGFKFEEGGYANSSALMENEYRWVLATAVEALAIYKAEAVPASGTFVTAVEAFLIALMVVSVLLVGGLFFCIYRCIFPGGWSTKGIDQYYGRLAENPFLAQKDKEWDQLNLRKRGGASGNNLSRIYGAL